MIKCPDCRAVLENEALSCPYCGSDAPALVSRSQIYSIDDKTAVHRATGLLIAALIAILLNPLYIPSFIIINAANKIKIGCADDNSKANALASAASTVAGLAVATSTIIASIVFIILVIS